MVELCERQMRLVLQDYLISQGWYPKNSTNSKDLFNLEAIMGDRKWIIDVKCPNPLVNEIGNLFTSGLGRILQRMDSPYCKYSLALPDTPPFIRLWKRLPYLVKQRTGITALFISSSGFVREDIN